MGIRVNSRNVDGVHEKKPAEPARTSYSNGHPVKPDSFVRVVGPAHHALSKSVGTRASVPLTPLEEGGITNDLKPLARGINLYDALPPKDREHMSRQQFAVRCAMLEVLLRGKKT